MILKTTILDAFFMTTAYTDCDGQKITETFLGVIPLMHSDEEQESHVLLEGDIFLASGENLFTIKAPYMDSKRFWWSMSFYRLSATNFLQ